MTFTRLTAFCAALRLRKRRKQDAHQQRDDRDDDEKFDKREAAPVR
ncbi:MAG: hypothetical protein QM783_16340 [Phycisphaerales bacterium]